MLFLVALALFVLFVGWVINRIRTSRMRNALGRDVRPEELTSLNSWMAVNEAEERKSQGQ